MRHVHVIPVDPSLTPEEAWKEICIFGRRMTYTGPEWYVGPASWANIECDGEECHNIERAEA